ncbi:SusD/RagB family nutrient-binding outer membrane lipoprotein [Sphingobacterium puteale]|uniref:SusD/RagB family nutrient-binding outer membrane lipoprotein n=1 Tax=Sphingobacterium puteale TaxID=2420510 RepID=UPI003D981A66
MKKIWTYLALGGVLLTTGCSKFDEINTNPETPSTVRPSMLATRIVLNLARQSNTKGFMQPYMLTKEIAWTELTESYQYNSLGERDISMMAINDAHFMAKFATSDALANSYNGLMYFARAMKFYDATMSVGDIPYKDALKGETEKIYFPKYDTQKEVFLGILNELELADKLFAEGVKFDGDPIFSGDIIKWRKLVNSFALNVLIQLSKKDADGELNVKERFKSIFINKPIFEGNADNFQVTHEDKADQTYPFYKVSNSFVIYPIVSTEIIDRLKQYQDRRLFYYANPSALQIANGKQSNDFNAYVGTDPSLSFSEIAELKKKNDYSKLNDRYTELVSGEPTQQYSYAHLCFVVAEAAARGWVAESPVNWYKKGIAASMKFISDNTPNTAQFTHNMPLDEGYINLAVTTYGNQFPVSPEGQLEAIITQKYLASYLQGVMTPYYDYRRTGYPKWKINPASSLNSVAPQKIPVRWRYPALEYNYNASNLDEAMKRQYDGNDEINQLMWILK